MVLDYRLCYNQQTTWKDLMKKEGDPDILPLEAVEAEEEDDKFED